MSKLRLVGAVGIKVRPDTSAFRRETQADLDKELGPDGSRAKARVKVEADLDTTQAKRKYKTLEQEMEGKTFKLNVGLDYDSVQKAKRQIEQSLNSLKNKVIPFELNKKSLLEAKRELAKLEQGAKVEFKIIRDEAGYQSVLDRIKRIRAEKGLTKNISFKTDKASLAKAEAEAKAGLARIEANKTVEIKYSNTYSGIQGAINDIDKRLETLRQLKIKTKLDDASLEATKAKLVAQLQDAPVTVKFNEDQAGYEKILSRIKEIRRQKVEQSVTFKTDDASLAATEEDVRAKLKAHIQEVAVKFRAAMDKGDIEEAKHQAAQLKDHIDHMKASMQIEASNTELTSARLAFLGRDRVVNYIAKVNERSVAVAEGLLKSIGGLNTFSSISKTFEGIFTKFDTYSLKVSTLATVLGSLANIGTYAGTAIFKVGEGVFQSLGLLAAAPAILGAATAGYTIFTAAFNNFFDAFNKDPKIAAESLKALPPIARKTVDSITGLYKGLANPIQEKFWEHVGDTLADSIQTLYPKLKDSLLDSTTAVGDFVAGIGKSMNKLALSPDIDKMFAGFKGFFENLSKASEPFFDAWNKFGVQGSQLLPMFGQWIANNAKRFDDWATKLSANGGINDMIMHGVSSLQEMWKVGGDVADIFKAITRAAGLAGTGGLAQFQLNLRKTADTMLSEPWQSKAATIFEGARKGASELNVGFKDLTGSLGASSVWLGTVLTQLGSIGGGMLTNLSDLLGSKTYQSGITAELQGLDTLVSSLRPSFVNLGEVIGGMGKVAGSVFSSMAPVINQLSTLLANVVTTLSDNLAQVAPKLLATIGGVLRVVAPVIEGLAKALNGVLGIMAEVPNSFVAMGVAATAFFAMRGLASKFFDSFKQTNTFKNLESNFLTSQIAAGKFTEKMKMVNGEMVAYQVPNERFNATRAGFTAITGGVDTFRSRLSELNGLMARPDGTVALSNRLNNLATVAMPGVAKAAGGLLSALGGGWGIAFMAIGAIIGIFAQAQADAARHTEELTAAVDKQTGSLNKSGLEAIAKSWTDLGKSGDAWANFTRGSKAANETAGLLKLNLAEVTKTLADGGPKSDQLGEKLQKLATAMSDLESFDPSAGSESWDTLKNRADEAARAFGFSNDELDKMGLKASDVQHLADNFREEATQVALAKKKFEELASATGQSTVQAQQMEAAIREIGDSSTTAASKIGAINKALDLLKGGKLSAREAQVKAQEDFQSAIQDAASMREELAKNQHLIDSTTGLIDITSSSGLKLQQTLKKAADGIKVEAMAAAQAVKDQGGNVAAQAQASQDVVNAHAGDLKAIADQAGVDVKTIQAEWDGFMGKKWELSAVFTAQPDKFLAAKQVVEDAGLEWNDKTYEAFLLANPDIAKYSVSQAEDAAKRYANNVYKAQLEAMNQDALQVILDAHGQADNYKNGDYTAVMRGINDTNPGVQAARANLLNATTHDGAGWKALVQAYVDAISKANAEASLNQLARTREMNVAVTYTSRNSPRPAMLDGNDNGSLTGSRFKPTRIKAFADGGFNGFQFEKPGPARIYPGSDTWRVFAEKSTGSEAYIPMAASKRQRSTQILAEVANQFGYRLASAQRFENGGITSSDRTGGSVNVSIGNYQTHASDTPDDVARALMRRVKAAGVYTPLEGF